MDIKAESITDDDSNELKCRECIKTFASRDDYLKHKINHKKTFECDVCGKVGKTNINDRCFKYIIAIL